MLVYPSGGGGGISNYDLIADGVYSVSDVARVNTEAELASAIAGAKNTILVDGDITLTGNHTVTQHLIIRNGAVITLDSNTLTIAGPFSAGRYQVFSGAGVEFDDDSPINDVYPEWWGAVVNDDSVSSEIAVQLAINSLSDRTETWKGVVRLSGIYWCLDKISDEADTHASLIVPKDGVSIIGNGWGTGFKAAGGLNDTYTIVNFIAKTGIISNCIFENFSIDWNGANNLLEAGDDARMNGAIMSNNGAINVTCRNILVTGTPGNGDIYFGCESVASQGNILVERCKFVDVGSGLTDNYNTDHTSVYLGGDGLKVKDCVFGSTNQVSGTMMECHGSRFEACGNKGKGYDNSVYFVTNIANGYDISYHHNYNEDVKYAFIFSLTDTFPIDDIKIHDNVFRMLSTATSTYFCVIAGTNASTLIERVSIKNNSFYGNRNGTSVRCFGLDLVRSAEICNNRIHDFEGYGLYLIGSVIATDYVIYKLVVDNNEWDLVGKLGGENWTISINGNATHKVQLLSVNGNVNMASGGNVFLLITAEVTEGMAVGNIVPNDGGMTYPIFPDTTAGKVYIEYRGRFPAPAGIACATGSKWLDTGSDTSTTWNGSAWA